MSRKPEVEPADGRRVLSFQNRQREQSVNLRRLRPVAEALLAELLELDRFDLSINLVSSAEMARLNATYLRHAGPTDVLAFDYADEPVAAPRRRLAPPALHGEIVLCVAEAVRQARRFRVSWQSELARYLVHGVLHLRGYDDQTTAARRTMKREETRLLCALARQFDLRTLARSAPARSRSGRSQRLRSGARVRRPALP